MVQPIGQAVPPVPDVSLRLQQLIAAWRGGEQGEQLAALHRECRSLVGARRGLLPSVLLMVHNLDKTTLESALGHRGGSGHQPHLQFRVPPIGRFDAALVPEGLGAGPTDRWILAVDERLPVVDQVALYGHAVGHILVREDLRQLIGPSAVERHARAYLDPGDGFTHVDNVAELALGESLSRSVDRRVLEDYPLLTDLLARREPRLAAVGSVSPDLRQKLGQSGWKEPYLEAPYRFTDGRVFVGSDGTDRRGPRLGVDALLRAEASLPIALVHTLRSGERAEDAERRLTEYARDRLSLPFAYLIDDGGAIHELDWSRTRDAVRSTVPGLPTREDLWSRWAVALGLTDDRAERALKSPYNALGRVKLRYYQEAAINRTVIAVLQAQRGRRSRRILLTLATGTGKTKIAFQAIWKLKQARLIGNVLFLSDRDFLLSQAMDNEFAPFGDARHRIQRSRVTSRAIYFATYQAIADTEGSSGLYRRYPRHFFDLIVVDECHRGSAADESNWRRILEHFDRAIQIGMTATPRRGVNAATYAYFGDPIISYSLRAGINDGFLAPYRVRRILVGEEPDVPDTRPDDTGEDRASVASTSGDPETAGGDDRGTAIADEVDDAIVAETAQTLRERTDTIAQHLGKYLRTTDPMAKTIVFCIDQAHAATMREAIEGALSDLAGRSPNYVERIVSDEGEPGRRELGRFTSPDEPKPVVVTTSKMLAVGVDVPTCKNIALVRPIGSMVEFKQIIGRGTRLHPPAKTWFTILDYAGATRLFFDPDFDGDPEVVVVEPLVPREAPVAQQPADEGGAVGVLSPEEEAPAGQVQTMRERPAGEYAAEGAGESGAAPEVRDSAAELAGHLATDVPGEIGDPSGLASRNGSAGLPSAPSPLAVAPSGATGSGDGQPESQPPAGGQTGDKQPMVARADREQASPQSAQGESGDQEPAADRPPINLTRRSDGRRFRVIGEVVYELGPDGTTLLRHRSSREFVVAAVADLLTTPADLRARWLRREQREEICNRLDEGGVDLRALASAQGLPDADPFDLLLHFAFDLPVRTRADRVGRVHRDHAAFLNRHRGLAREVLKAILDKYVAGEIDDVGDSGLLHVPPLLERGTFVELARPFGGGAGVRAALAELHRLLYSDM
ncbi:MAG: DEAD/DEAH box helicase family protein [Chloroflexi bacterium]|nr:DEAD/DEAH box helicase family protein [Chloroflexota bacterium]